MPQGNTEQIRVTLYQFFVISLLFWCIYAGVLLRNKLEGTGNPTGSIIFFTYLVLVAITTQQLWSHS